jgi:hypothetical protein
LLLPVVIDSATWYLSAAIYQSNAIAIPMERLVVFHKKKGGQN